MAKPVGRPRSTPPDLDTLRSVRGIPETIWQEARVEAARQHTTIGALLTHAIDDYLRERHRAAVLAAAAEDQ